MADSPPPQTTIWLRHQDPPRLWLLMLALSGLVHVMLLAIVFPLLIRFNQSQIASETIPIELIDLESDSVRVSPEPFPSTVAISSVDNTATVENAPENPVKATAEETTGPPQTQMIETRPRPDNFFSPTSSTTLPFNRTNTSPFAEENTPPPARGNPSPPLEESPSPPLEENPSPSLEESPSPPLEEGPSPSLEENDGFSQTGGTNVGTSLGSLSAVIRNLRSPERVRSYGEASSAEAYDPARPLFTSKTFSLNNEQNSCSVDISELELYLGQTIEVEVAIVPRVDETGQLFIEVPGAVPLESTPTVYGQLAACLIQEWEFAPAQHQLTGEPIEDFLIIEVILYPS